MNVTGNGGGGAGGGGGGGSASRTVFDYTSAELPWSQITPPYMPWGHPPTAPAAPLVTFTGAQQLGCVDGSAAGANRHQLAPGAFAMHAKRKADYDLTTPVKQHITEEKMAAHMSRLHISTESADVRPPDQTEEPEVQEKRLFVCEEMRRLQTESILPSALLGRLERPCMAVMLWQPPPKLSEMPPFHSRSSSSASLSSGIADEPEPDNNNSLTVDLNSMDFDG